MRRVESAVDAVVVRAVGRMGVSVRETGAGSDAGAPSFPSGAGFGCGTGVRGQRRPDPACGLPVPRAHRRRSMHIAQIAGFHVRAHGDESS